MIISLIYPSQHAKIEQSLPSVAAFSELLLTTNWKQQMNKIIISSCKLARKKLVQTK